MSTEGKSNATPEATLSEALLGKEFFETNLWARWKALSSSARVAWASGVFAFFLFVPYLGAVGLWDPWETHYGEVARQMIARRDYVHPFWENAWFFSKPAFTMWLQALGMQLVSAVQPDGALGRFTEWGFRLPFAALSIAAVVLMAVALTRTVSRRAGLAWTFVICTTPLYFLITRQAVTDTPMIAALISALACALIGQLDPETRHRTAWWYGFYFFCGVGTLAKGLLGVGIPAVIFVLYALLVVVPWNEPDLARHLRWLTDSRFRAETLKGQQPMPALWAQFFKMRLLTGILLFSAVTVPWYLRMILFEGVDDEGKLFWYRFFIHDHLSRLGAGVHTTTPGGSFTYFIEQGGYALFPWVLLVPGAFVMVSRLKLRSEAPEDHVGFLAVLWAALTFFVIGASATKFHHYVLPMLPPMAILIALFLDRLWVDGLGRHVPTLLMGAPLYALVAKDLAQSPKNFTDLFVYNYDRPYPTELVTRSLGALGGRPLWLGDVLAVTLFLVGGYSLLSALSEDRERSTAVGRGFSALLLFCGVALFVVTLSRGAVSPLACLGVAAVGAAVFFIFEATRLSPSSPVLHFLALLVGGVGVALLAAGFSSRAQDPLLPLLTELLNLKRLLGFVFVAGGLGLAFALARGSRTGFFATGWGLVTAFALWFNWFHWVDLSHHWTQRDLFWRYYAQRQEGEPIAAFLMNWRGETFYSQNRVKQIKDNALMTQFAKQPGREWALVEHARINILKTAVGPEKTVTLIDKDLNNKFVLVTIDG